MQHGSAAILKTVKLSFPCNCLTGYGSAYWIPAVDGSLKFRIVEN